MKKSMGAAVLAGMFLSSGANAYNYPFSSVDSWRIVIDRQEKSCVAKGISGKSDPGLLFKKAGGDVAFVLNDPKLSNLRDHGEYDSSVLVDEMPWNGKVVAATRNTDIVGVIVPTATDAFLSALRKGNQIRLKLGGKEYGPYSLSSTAKALDALNVCYKVALLGEQEITRAKPAAKAVVQPAPPKVSALAPASTLEKWTNDGTDQMFTSGDTRVTFTHPKASTTLFDTLLGPTMKVEVTRTGFETISFDIRDSLSITGSIGLIKLDRTSDQPELYFTNTLKGTTEFRAVSFADGKTAKLIEFGEFKTVFADPSDLDGDGYVEMAVPDDRFTAFQGADESAVFPANVYGMKNGAALNLTQNQGMVPFHERLFQRQSELCGNSPIRKPGQCAAMVGTAATMGMSDAALELIFRFKGNESESPANAPYTICRDAKCADKKKIESFKDAVLYALDAWEYAQPAEDKAVDDFMTQLAGKSFGTETGEQACGGELERYFQEGVSARGKPLFAVQEFEDLCVMGKSTAVGQSLLFHGVCQTEEFGTFRIVNRMYNWDGKRLASTEFERGTYAGNPVDDLKECSASDMQTNRPAAEE